MSLGMFECGFEIVKDHFCHSKLLSNMSLIIQFLMFDLIFLTLILYNRN